MSCRVTLGEVQRLTGKVQGGEIVMSQDIGDTRTYGCRSGCCSFLVSAGGLVVAGGSQDQLAQEPQPPA